MARRKIIEIDQEKCTGCGDCIPNCPEGALQIIDGKARLISDLFCDGLGACIGSCPVDAIIIEEREAERYDERKVMENIVKQGENTIKAHLEHLRGHGQTAYLKQALDLLKEKGTDLPKGFGPPAHGRKAFAGCPGAQTMQFAKEEREVPSAPQASSLRQWPIQLHLVSPNAPYFQGKDILLTADCAAYAYGDFHAKYLAEKSLAIGCPKLDSDQEIYTEKLIALIDQAKINTLTVMIMEVPCCRGLLSIAQEALKRAKRKIPLKCVVVGIQGHILSEEWIAS